MPKIRLNRKVIKFGKKISDIKKFKNEFFTNNNLLLTSQIKKRKIYSRQPRRTKCKVCKNSLRGKEIKVQEIKYLQCKTCSHLNGIYQDTYKFVNKIYSSQSVNYSKRYFEKDKKNYVDRVKKIYDPKALFLKSNIKNFKELKILDIGTGSGYFISALKRNGFKNVLGIEVSKDQINYGKQMLEAQNINSSNILHVPFDRLNNFLHSFKDFNCVSLIGVIEHFQNMKQIIDLVVKNKSCELIYVSVPLFSLTALVESIFSEVFNRHLGGSHTHLFTEKSLKFFFKKVNFVSHSEWWFGQDFNDLFRSLVVMNNKLKNSNTHHILNKFHGLIDNFQIILDNKKMSSEVHILFKRK